MRCNSQVSDLAFGRICAYHDCMKPSVPDRDKLEADGAAPEAGYPEWKRAKIEQGLAESRLRESLIPIEQIWNDLKLER